MKTFKDRIRSESVLVRLSSVGACRGINPLSNFLVSARGQISHWAIFLIYTVEQIARPGHLLGTHVPLEGYLPADVKVAQHFPACLIHLGVLFPQEMKLLRSRDVFFIRGISHN